MAQEDRDFVIARRFLVGVTLFVGCGVFSAFADLQNSRSSAFIGFFVTIVMFPVIGSVVARMCVAMRTWAYENAEPLERSNLVGIAAIWPVAFCYAVVVYPCVGIIHRIFPN